MFDFSHEVSVPWVPVIPYADMHKQVKKKKINREMK